MKANAKILNIAKNKHVETRRRAVFRPSEIRKPNSKEEKRKPKRLISQENQTYQWVFELPDITYYMFSHFYIKI